MSFFKKYLLKWIRSGKVARLHIFSRCVLSLQAFGGEGGLLRDPVRGILASVCKSRPSLRAGGLNGVGDYCVIPLGGSLHQYVNPVRRYAPAVF